MRLLHFTYATRKSRQRGSGLLLTLGAMALMVGTFGAAIDFSHLYMVRSELEALADEAALRAARELDGTQQGLSRARRLVRGVWNGSPKSDWLTFSTDELYEIRAEFAADPDGPWQTAPRSAAGLRFVRLNVAAKARLLFLPMWPWMPASQQVAAATVAGQETVRRPLDSLPVELRVDPQPSGFEAGESYAVRINGGADCRTLGQRFLYDTDTAATDYTSYVETGNGRRLLAARVETSPAAFVTMFLQRDSGETCTATYAGDAPVIGTGKNGAGEAGVYEVRLLR